MICPVEIAGEMFAFLAARIGEDAKHVLLHEGRNGAGDEVQEVMLQAMAQKITWWQVAEIIGIRERHMRLWRAVRPAAGNSFRRSGFHWRWRSRFWDCIGTYCDLNVRHFHEKLGAEHQIELSYSWVKQALQGAGLVSRGRKRGMHCKRRAAAAVAGDPVTHRRQPTSLVSRTNAGMT
jgi:hypothetical protein